MKPNTARSGSNSDRSPAAADQLIAPRSIVQRCMLWLISTYQRTAPARAPRCRYIPSCSQYAHEAIANHGAWRGGRLALRRLSRCHPLGSFGFDPVPPPRTRDTHSLPESRGH